MFQILTFVYLVFIFLCEMIRGGYVYIITNKNKTVLYTGVTSDLVTRMHQHKTGVYPNSFSKRYNLTVLVYYKSFQFITDAIAEEKRIKAGSRKAKERLIEEMNPGWGELTLV